MVNIKSVPEYIFEASRGYQYVIAMRMKDGSLLYQRVCKSKREANKRLAINQGWRGNIFEIYSLNEIAR